MFTWALNLNGLWYLLVESRKFNLSLSLSFKISFSFVSSLYYSSFFVRLIIVFCFADYEIEFVIVKIVEVLFVIIIIIIIILEQILGSHKILKLSIHGRTRWEKD